MTKTEKLRRHGINDMNIPEIIIVTEKKSSLMR